MLLPTVAAATAAAAARWLKVTSLCVHCHPGVEEHPVSNRKKAYIGKNEDYAIKGTGITTDFKIFATLEDRHFAK